jgi:hypothetical protein
VEKDDLTGPAGECHDCCSENIDLLKEQYGITVIVPRTLAETIGFLELTELR